MFRGNRQGLLLTISEKEQNLPGVNSGQFILQSHALLTGPQPWVASSRYWSRHALNPNF